MPVSRLSAPDGLFHGLKADFDVSKTGPHSQFACGLKNLFADILLPSGFQDGGPFDSHNAAR